MLKVEKSRNKYKDKPDSIYMEIHGLSDWAPVMCICLRILIKSKDIFVFMQK